MSEKTTTKISDWHRHVVTMYYRKLLLRFGKDRLLRVIPKIKSYLWNSENLAVVEAHI